MAAGARVTESSAAAFDKPGFLGCDRISSGVVMNHDEPQWLAFLVRLGNRAAGAAHFRALPGDLGSDAQIGM